MAEFPDAELPVPEVPAASGSEAEGGLKDVDATVSLPQYVDGTPVVLSKGNTNNVGHPELQALMRKLFQVSKTLQGVASKEISNEMDLFAPSQPPGPPGGQCGPPGAHPPGSDPGAHPPGSEHPPGVNPSVAPGSLVPGKPAVEYTDPYAQNEVHTTSHRSIPGFALVAASLAPSSLPRRRRHDRTDQTLWSSFFPRVADTA